MIPSGWRRFDQAMTGFWILMVPAALITGWIKSVAFVAAISIYANAAAHLAAWRADA